jgi:hypothetical protein
MIFNPKPGDRVRWEGLPKRPVYCPPTGDGASWKGNGECIRVLPSGLLAVIWDDDPDQAISLCNPAWLTLIPTHYAEGSE